MCTLSAGSLWVTGRSFPKDTNAIFIRDPATPLVSSAA
jgi:hypothetical protein